MMRAARRSTAQHNPAGVVVKRRRRTGRRSPRSKTNMNRSLAVEVFPPLASAACSAEGCRLKCDHCRQGPTTRSPRLDLAGLRGLLDNAGVEWWWADYSTEAGRLEACNRLNRLLAERGTEMTVGLGTLDTFLEQAAPVVAVNGRIISIIVLPTMREFVDILPGPS